MTIPELNEAFDCAPNAEKQLEAAIALMKAVQEQLEEIEVTPDAKKDAKLDQLTIDAPRLESLVGGIGYFTEDE